MFGANKRLRDLGKETVDYTNYNTPSAKVKRYREQVYGTNTTYNKNNSSAGKVVLFIFIIFFILPTVLPFFILFTETVNEFEDSFDGTSSSLGDTNITINEETTVTEKYDEYDQEWVKKYYKFFYTQNLGYYDPKIAMADINFDDVPEIFYFATYKRDNATYSLNRIYYIDNYQNIVFGTIPNYQDIGLYYSKIDNQLMWLNPYVFNTQSLWLYKYSVLEKRSIYEIDNRYTNYEMFNNDFDFTGYNLEYFEDEDFGVSFYQMVDNYLEKESVIDNYINNYK